MESMASPPHAHYDPARSGTTDVETEQVARPERVADRGSFGRREFISSTRIRWD
jgi:hypothetical protein